MKSFILFNIILFACCVIIQPIEILGTLSEMKSNHKLANIVQVCGTLEKNILPARHLR